MLSRLGYDASKMIDPVAFNDLKKFNTTQTAAIVGTATQKITQEGLDVISTAIRNYEREAQYEQTGVQRNDNARKARIQHGIVRGRAGDTGGYSERGAADGISRQADEPLVSVQRGTEGVRSPAQSSEGRGAPDREILDGTQGLSLREEIPDVRGSADERRAEQTLQRDQTGVHSDGAAANETDGDQRRSEQRIAEQELVGVRTGNEQSSTESDQDRDERTRLQLTDNQEQTAENDERSDSAFSVSEEKPADRWQPTDEKLSVSEVVSSYTTSYRNYTFYLLKKENGKCDIRIGERPDGKKAAYPPDDNMLDMETREDAEKYFDENIDRIIDTSESDIFRISQKLGYIGEKFRIYQLPAGEK